MHQLTWFLFVKAVQLCVLHGLQSGCHLLYTSDMQIKHYQFPRSERVISGVFMLLDAELAVSVRAQPQINPLRATENPHSVIMTGLLGTLASSTA